MWPRSARTSRPYASRVRAPIGNQPNGLYNSLHFAASRSLRSVPAPPDQMVMLEIRLGLNSCERSREAIKQLKAAV